MGQAKANQKAGLSATKKLLEQYPICCFCGGGTNAATREHMPPKALFDDSHRPDKLVMPACDSCNRGTSTADLVASILARWQLVLTEQEKKDHARLAAGVRSSNPELIAEWTTLDEATRLKAKLEHNAPADSGVVAIGPLTIRQLNLFSHKVVLGLYFDHFREALPDAGRICAYWRSKEDIRKGGLPPILFEMMNRYGTLEQGKWNTHEIFEYRFEVNENDGLFACLARLRGALFVTGFAVKDAQAIVADEAADWIAPSGLLGILTDPTFEKRRG
jgi:hypothetical protein